MKLCHTFLHAITTLMTSLKSPTFNISNGDVRPPKFHINILSSQISRDLFKNVILLSYFSVANYVYHKLSYSVNTLDAKRLGKNCNSVLMADVLK